ncbi:hypothetical protein V2J09_004262 [Rumex salicifolius]
MYGFTFFDFRSFRRISVTKNRNCSEMVRTVWTSSYFDRRLSDARLERRTAAAPILNMQLQRSIDRSFPKYQFRVMFSVEKTSATELGFARRRCLARSTEMSPAEHPMPPRLKLLIDFFIL